MNFQTCNREDLEKLVASEGGAHLSALLPAPSTRNDTLQEDKIRFSNMMRSAREALAKNWMQDSEADDFLRPVELQLQELLQSNPRRIGVAIFANSESLNLFQVRHEIQEQLAIGHAFRIRPMLPCLDSPVPYTVLTLSQQRVAFFAKEQQELEQVEGIQPESFDEIEADLESTTQVRTTAIGGRGQQQGVFYGHGSGRDAEKVDLENYLKHVDNSVCSYLRQQTPSRLILAGVDSLTAMYRANSHWDDIIEATLTGNVDHLSAEELQVRAEAIAGDELHAQRKQRWKRIREQVAPVETDPELVLIAAHDGRIETLFVDQDATLYGSFSAEARALKQSNDPPSGGASDNCHDMLELAAVQTLKMRGNVYSVSGDEMPIATKMAAELRF